MPKLAIFDVDGTIAKSGEFPRSVVKGFQRLHQLGYTTTVSTGRGYIRAKEAFGEHFDQLISDDALLLLEHGTKITDKKGNTVFIEEFSAAELDHIVDFVRANINLFEIGWYNPNDPKRKPEIWVIDQKDLAAVTEKRGYYANIWHSSITEFKQRLTSEVLSNVTLRLKPHVKVHNLKLALTRTDMHIIFQDDNMEFVKSNTNKALAILYLMKHLGVSYADVLVAGNAINDIEMLDLEVGRRILVGPKDERDTVLAYLSAVDGVIQVPSPEHLGLYLQKL